LSGGEQLTPQETRNAIFDGPLNRLCIKLSKSPSLCRLWDIPEPEQAEIEGGLPSDARSQHEPFRRMEDVELVLRFFAYRQKHRLHKGTSLWTYLDQYLRQGNEFSSATLEQMEQLFLETVNLVEEVFGPRAFWLFRKRGRESNWTWRESPTQTVYDPLMLVVSTHRDDAAALRSKAPIFRDEIATFYQNNYEVFEGRNVNPSALSERERKFQELFIDVLARP
jgi:hypothetical protein